MPNTDLKQLLFRLWLHTSKRRRIQSVFLLLVMLLASVAEVVSIGAVLPFLGALTAPDQVFAHPMAQPIVILFSITEPEMLLLPLTIIFASCAILSGLTRLLLLFVLTRFSHAVGADFSINIYRRTLYQPYTVHVSRNSSEVIAGISNKANALVYSTIMPLLNILSASLMLILILLTLIFIEPVLALSTFAGFGAIYVVVIFASRKILLRDSERVNKKLNQVFKALQEGLGGIRDVLIDGAQVAYCKIYRSADIPLRRAQANIAIISNSPRFGIEALGMVLISVVAYLFVSDKGDFSEAIPVLGALALGAQRVLPMLQLVYSSWTAMLGGQVPLRESLNLLDQPLPNYAGAEPPAPMPFKRSIDLNNLSFKYTKDTPWVLQDGFNLRISKGSRVGFMGSTGSGKSTVLDIIMGLLPPTGGSLAIDGVDITEENQRAWATHIAHVPQTIFLADISIAENIAFGIDADKIDHSRVHEAARQAQIAETIESWSEQYDTVVGERGVRLSGGQRQRIGIARALYKKADVIVFDEATSALDNDTEMAVMDAINGLNEDLTIIMVAHRLTTLKKCTEIVELKDGRVNRVGTYADMV
jgi:ATP-binding cassette subfamily B protein